MLFRRIVLHALLVGAVAGLLLAAVQAWQVVPIIKSAERFEGAAMTVASATHAHDHTDAASDREWEPSDGVERTAYTLLADVLVAIGLAMVLLPAMIASLKYKTNMRLNWRHGLLWGAAGYAVFFLAPGLGLPPEIPGQAAAPLEARQMWWFTAVLCTATGLAGAAFSKSGWRWAFLGLLAVPYLLGAPEGPAIEFPGQPPEAAAALEELARQFIGATAIANGVLWLALGLASVWAIRRIVPPSHEPVGN